MWVVRGLEKGKMLEKNGGKGELGVGFMDDFSKHRNICINFDDACTHHLPQSAPSSSSAV